MRYLLNMRRGACIIACCCFLSLAVKSQQQHFIYIQADNKTPFSVRLNGKYYSSSSIGYLILPKLADGTYTLQVGFAQNSFPEQAFTLDVKGKDYGYALKNFDAKGWGLFNFQTTDIVMNSTAPQPEKQPTAVAATSSAFGNMLANVIDDSTINNVAATDTVAAAKPESITAATAMVQDTARVIENSNSTDTANSIGINKEVTSTDTALTAAVDTATQDTVAFTSTGVIKAWENAGDKGTDIMFIDFNGTQNDTINAFIPAGAQEKKAVSTDTIPAAIKATVADTSQKTVNNPFFDQSSNKQTAAADSLTITKSDVVSNTVSITAPPLKALDNAACKDMLSEGDLGRLKKKIIAQSSQYGALATVRKALRDKCIATGQVKDLGNLFLNDESRYGFYEAAYPFVYDAGSYSSLESTLIDSYFKNRFKALLR